MNKSIYLLCVLSFLILNSSLAQTVSISGKVVRHNGDGVEGVMVTCTNATSVVTGADGSFTFTDLPEGEDYTINGDYETSVVEDITVLDAVFARHLILFILQVPTLHLAGGDLNQSGSVTSFDIVMMQKAALKMSSPSFPVDYWRFYNSDAGSLSSQPGIYLQNLTQDTSGLQLVAVKSGDVAIDADHLPPPPSAPNPQFYIPDAEVTQNSEFTIEMKARDFYQILGFQHSLNWDPAVLEFISLEEQSPYYFVTANEEVSDQGTLPVFGIDYNDIINGANLEDDSTLYVLNFKALQDISSLESVIDFSENLIDHQAVYFENNEIFLVDQTYQVGSPPTANNEISNLEFFNISPNPAADNAFVELRFENAEKGTFQLFDLNGKSIRLWEIDGKNIYETLYLRDLSSGTYILKLRTSKGVMTKKLVKQ